MDSTNVRTSRRHEARNSREFISVTSMWRTLQIAWVSKIGRKLTYSFYIDGKYLIACSLYVDKHAFKTHTSVNKVLSDKKNQLTNSRVTLGHKKRAGHPVQIFY